jgi:putative oxidoreductase
MNLRIVQTLFAIPWLVFGIQHFMYADFVANLVPGYFPARLFIAYFAGAAMIAAGISFIVSIKARLAATLLGVMLLIFIFLIHVPTLAGESPTLINLTRSFQDISLAAAAFILAGALSKGEVGNDFVNKIAKLSRYVFAIMLIVFAVQQFLDMDFLTAKVAPYLPLRTFLVYFTGAAMVITAASILTNKKPRLTAFTLGVLMLILNLLLYVYLLAGELRDPRIWTAAMINLAITCGAFIVANSTPTNREYEINI